ncbi:DNA glycosylase [Xylariomycetidae sp. FL2044]|nr:DNA glycosylase [Xylariomycetidae sp. FL2044]
MARAKSSSSTLVVDSDQPRRRSARNLTKTAAAEQGGYSQEAEEKSVLRGGQRGIKRRKVASSSSSSSSSLSAEPAQNAARRSKKVKLESPEAEEEESIRTTTSSPPPPSSTELSPKRRISDGSKSTPSPKKKKKEKEKKEKSGKTSTNDIIIIKTPESKALDLQAKKLKSYTQFGSTKQSPFPTFAHPTAAECKRAHQILSALHGERKRPAADNNKAVVAPRDAAGCGTSPSVLDALVRTILSQNTSDRNSTRAKLSMDRVYGGSDRWEAIASGGQAKLQRTIACGGLSQTKSRVILSILEECRQRHGGYSLDHLFGATDDEAMREMLGFRGVGPKTASCVLLFCLGRASFAVDTHVHRLAGLLGWRPPGCTREEAHAHLDARVPDEDKYGLHVLLIRHGKTCAECRAGGKSAGKCELRKAFRKGGAVDGDGEIKGEEEEEGGDQKNTVKKEEDDEEEKKKKKKKKKKKGVKMEEEEDEDSDSDGIAHAVESAA